jgi:hypothetical protein
MVVNTDFIDVIREVDDFDLNTMLNTQVDEPIKPLSLKKITIKLKDNTIIEIQNQTVKGIFDLISKG